MPEVSTPLDEEYWESIYAQPQTMDGIFNATLHTDYLQALFRLDGVEVNSVLDVGFGLGHLFNAVIKRFKPYRAVGIEPSDYAFAKARDTVHAAPGTRLKLLPMDVQRWCSKPRKPMRFDLTLCTSVLQYLDDDSIRSVIPVLSRRTRYMYLTVPTDIEAQRMSSDYDFNDDYARHRTRLEYRELLEPHFTFVSNRLLESKVFFDETTSPFTELLFRSE
jgi:SAM-dependent methyltransferase